MSRTSPKRRKFSLLLNFVADCQFGYQRAKGTYRRSLHADIEDLVADGESWLRAATIKDY
jgi:hypothetical protein